jgi:3-oxoacyl-[acyl-carrier protein] reductase
LGQGVAECFLGDERYNVVTCGRKKSEFIEQQEQSPNSDRFWFAPVDISQDREVADFVVAARKRFGSVDILINNAGIALDGVLPLQGIDDVDSMLRINLRGTIVMSKACSREMIVRRWGRIINITSVVGKTGYRGLSVYSLTKAGLDGFTRALAREMGERGITVNSVAPGFLATEMTHGLTEDNKRQIARRTPVGRLGEVKDVTPLVSFLCSDAASFITGQTIIVDGGLSA